MTAFTRHFDPHGSPPVGSAGVRDATRAEERDDGPISAAALAFTLVRDRPAFDALEAEWNALFARSGRPHQVFQSFAWNWYWSRAFLDPVQARGAGCPIAVLVGRRAGRVVTLWPMTFERRKGFGELAWMGEPVSQYGDILVCDREPAPLDVMRQGWAHLIAELEPDLVRLRKVRADATIAPLLATVGSLHTSRLEAPYVDLTRAKDFAAYEERFPNRAKRNRRRQMRRLGETGTVAFRHLDEGAEAARYAATGIEMKRRWLIDRGHVSPALADARMARFMTAAAAGGDRTCSTRVAVLTSGDEPAAIQIGFTAGNTRVMHIIAYDRKFEKMAAGVLHLEEAIRHAFVEKLDRLDLLAPKAEYKIEWADGSVPVIDHAIGLSLAGKAYARVYLGFVRGHLKTAIERLPHRVRQRLVTSHLKAVSRRLVVLFGLG